MSFEKKDLPIKIISTEELSLATKALIGEGGPAVMASDTFRVPRPVEHVEQELVENRLLAAGACK